jgi:5-methyltetrahydropteroyltriglutamate--homocysteine methyltransferase
MAPKLDPPFRVDQVGSLLRPAALKEARAAHAAGRISAAELAAIEDREIEAVVARQESIGLSAVTDGEFRRSWWHYDYLWQLDGVEKRQLDAGIQFAGTTTRAEAPFVHGRIKFSTHPFVDHFRFLRAKTRRTPKMTIPSPSMLHFRHGRKIIAPGLYDDMRDYYADLGTAYRDGVRAFYDAGCRYLQLDDISFAYLCDPAQKQMMRDRGDDPDAQAALYAGVVEAAIKDRPADLAISMHLCRGNFRSTFVASGGYEPIAELLFNAMSVDSYFLEFDSERAGDFAPLRFLPAGKTVVLGLVSSKIGALETKDAVKRRIDEATRYVPLERLCLSTQCGFASTEEGNLVAEAEQWRKLALIVEIAAEVWG